MHKPANSPIKVIGGQHRFEAIRFALENSADVLHGVKVYFALDMPRRLDVQLISKIRSFRLPWLLTPATAMALGGHTAMTLTSLRSRLRDSFSLVANTSTALCGPSFPGQNVGVNSVQAVGTFRTDRDGDTLTGSFRFPMQRVCATRSGRSMPRIPVE